MDQEMNTIIQNIASLLEQLKQMSSGGAQTEGKPEVEEIGGVEKILKYLKEMEEGKPEEEKKEEVAKSDEGPTANDKAEARVNEQGEENEKNIKEVAKAIAEIMAQKSVKKSNVDSEIAKVVKVLAEEVTELRKAQENILTGLGVADKILKDNEIKKSENGSRKLENDPNEIKKTLDEIKNMIGVKEESSTTGDAHAMAKSLSDENVLRSIFYRNGFK